MSSSSTTDNTHTSTRTYNKLATSEPEEIELGESARLNENFSLPPSRQASPAIMPGHKPATNAVNLNSPTLAVLAYCGSSILMTVTNKYMVSGTGFNLTFVLLIVQAVVCIAAIGTGKALGMITYRDFSTEEAKKWFPISVLLVGMIYTSMKALQFLSIPVYTIFKNLTIILIAYGEVLWFGGSVTGLALLSFGLMVLSSVIAAWADISHALASYGGDAKTGQAGQAIATLNAGYIWMGLNCLCSAGYVLGMRKRIKLTNFKDFDTMYYNNLLSIPILVICSLILEDWSAANLALNFPPGRQWPMIAAMIFTGLSSIFISYCSAWCVRVTSSTTYSMVGALNKLPIAISGLVFFDAPVTLASVSAIFVGFVSGMVYAVAQIWKKRSEAEKSSLPTAATNTTSSSSQSTRDSLKA